MIGKDKKKYDNIWIYNKIPSYRNENNDYYYERNNKINYYMNNIYENRNNWPQSQERNAGLMNIISFLFWKILKLDYIYYIYYQKRKKKKK
jgi:hypothetical protein